MKSILPTLVMSALLGGAGSLAAQTNTAVAKMATTNTEPAMATGTATNAPSATNSVARESAAGTNSSALAVNGYSSQVNSSYLRDISDRNIFDQSRRPRSRYTPAPDTTRPSRVESFTLTGVGLDNNQGSAMFYSANAMYRKTLGAGDSIAGYRIAEITPDLDSIKLSAASNQVVTMRVGMEMRKRDNGPWLLASRSDTTPSTAVASDSDKTVTNGASTAAAAPGSNGLDDVIKRMMERRAKE